MKTVVVITEGQDPANGVRPMVEIPDGIRPEAAVAGLALAFAIELMAEARKKGDGDLELHADRIVGDQREILEAHGCTLDIDPTAHPEDLTKPMWTVTPR